MGSEGKGIVDPVQAIQRSDTNMYKCEPGATIQCLVNYTRDLGTTCFGHATNSSWPDTPNMEANPEKKKKLA